MRAVCSRAASPCARYEATLIQLPEAEPVGRHSSWYLPARVPTCTGAANGRVDSVHIVVASELRAGSRGRARDARASRAGIRAVAADADGSSGTTAAAVPSLCNRISGRDGVDPEMRGSHIS